MSDDVEWTPPGPGQWGTVPDHFAKPVCRLFVELFPAMIPGSAMGARRYGVSSGRGPGMRCAAVNSWLYFASGGPAEPDDLDEMEKVAAETLATSRWREDARLWWEEERPAIVAKNLELQDEDLALLDDAALGDHLERAIAHYREVAPLHFAHVGGAFAFGVLAEALEAAGLDRALLTDLVTGAGTAQRAGRDHVVRIADALDRAGAGDVHSLEEIHAASEEASLALAEYLRLHGHRLVENRDLVDPTLHERPDLIVRAVRAVRIGSRADGAAAVYEAAMAKVRAAVPSDELAELEQLVADARACYGIGDDDEGVCFLWTQGLIRRAVLEAGRRLVARGAAGRPADLLDATSAEILGLLAGAGEPSAATLAARRTSRERAASLDPPPVIGEDGEGVSQDRPPSPAGEMPPSVARLQALQRSGGRSHGGPAGEPLRGLGVGTGSARGTARCVADAGDAFDRLEPGDVLVAIATNPGFNAVLPIVSAVVTEEGGPRCHAALLARELGIPAVVGLGGIREIRDGDVIEVDAAAGAVRILERTVSVQRRE